MSKRKQQREAIGKGLGALLQSIDTQGTARSEDKVKQLANAVAQLPVSQIVPNRYQPREEFDVAELQELADSIKTYGLIQPITVRRLKAGSYELISGERRLRASKLAGLEEVPAYIRLADDQEMMEMALVENIQRADLNPMEVALTYSRLLEEFDLTHEQVSERVGKGRVTITNFLSLLKLPDLIQNGIRNQDISAGHGREIARIKDFGLQEQVFRQVIDKNLSVSQTTRLIKSMRHPSSTHRNSQAHSLPDSYRDVQDQLRKHFGIKKIAIDLKKEGSGKIVIPFHSVEELNDFLDRLE